MKSGKLLIGILTLLAGTIVSRVDIQAQGTEMGVCEAGRGSGFKGYMSMEMMGAGVQRDYIVNQTYDSNNLRITSDGFYAVAMGTYYGTVGDKFIATFSNGQQVPVVLAEWKSNHHNHPSCPGMADANGGVIEPIITTQNGGGSNPDKLAATKYHGNVGTAYPELFAGSASVTSLRKVSGAAPSSDGHIIQQTATAESGPSPQDLEIKAEAEAKAQAEAEAEAIRLEQEQIQIAKEKAEAEAEAERLRIEEEQRVMAIFIPNSDHTKLVFLDTEFEQGRDLVQAAFMIYEQIDESENYFLTTSLNVFVNTHVSKAFEDYTGIKRGFLGNEGLPSVKAKEVINEFIKENGINEPGTLVIGHGINQDLIVLNHFGCEIRSEEYDTLEGAKRILNRSKNLKLSDLLLDAGLIQSGAHDAYQDTRNLVPIYAHLKFVESKQQREIL